MMPTRPHTSPIDELVGRPAGAMRNYLDLALAPAALSLQAERGSRDVYDTSSPGLDRLSAEEIEQITSAQHFYMGTVNEDGWPYVQHRGGEIGFVHQLGPRTIGWAERRGNRQYIGAGNLTANGRISMIFVDYPTRTRLKLLGTAVLVRDPGDELLEMVGASGRRNDGVITVDVQATNWNCPKFIEPRFTAEQIDATVQPLRDRIADLEAALRDEQAQASAAAASARFQRR